MRASNTYSYMCMHMYMYMYAGVAPRRTTAKRGGDPKTSVSHRIAEGLPVRSLILAPKRDACYVCNATRYGARGHGLPHTLGRMAEPGLGR